MWLGLHPHQKAHIWINILRLFRLFEFNVPVEFDVPVILLSLMSLLFHERFSLNQPSEPLQSISCLFRGTRMVRNIKHPHD